VFAEMPQRAACKMNSSFRAFTRHCSAVLQSEKEKPRTEEKALANKL
jgi:hypothetical protein